MPEPATFTLDEIAAIMRDRFTAAASSGKPVYITGDEWNAMAQGVYLADELERLVGDRKDGDALKAKALLKATRTGR